MVLPTGLECDEAAWLLTADSSGLTSVLLITQTGAKVNQTMQETENNVYKCTCGAEHGTTTTVAGTCNQFAKYI